MFEMVLFLCTAITDPTSPFKGRIGCWEQTFTEVPAKTLAACEALIKSTEDELLAEGIVIVGETKCKFVTGA